MATTFKKLAEQAALVLYGGSPNNDDGVDIRELVLYIKQAFGSLVKKSLFDNSNEGIEDVNGNFVYSFDDVVVSLDANKNMYYSILPSATIDLPNDLGVFHVSMMQSQDSPFVRVPSGFLALSRNMTIANLQTRKGFFVEGGRVYYTNLTFGDIPEKMLIKLVAGVESLTESDQINMPLNMQDAVVKMAIQLYTLEEQTPKDEIDDGNK